MACPVIGTLFRVNSQSAAISDESSSANVNDVVGISIQLEDTVYRDSHYKTEAVSKPS